MLKSCWSTKKLGDKDYFEILGSRIDKFNGEKEYLSTSSIDKNKIVAIEEIITYQKRPSRANMQPRLNSVWFAKMKNTVKIYSFSEENKNEITKYILSTGFVGILCNVKKVYLKYLEKIFLSKWFNDLKDESTHGSTQQAINNQEIKDFEIPLPSLPEQKKIVYVLDAIQEAIKVQEKIIEKAQELKRSLMHKLFKEGTGGAKLKKTEIGEIPENWEVIKAQSFCDFVTDGTHDTPKESEKGYFLVTSKNLKNGKLNLNDAYKISEKDFKEVNKRSKVDQFDVIFGMIGTIGSPVLVLDKNPDFAIKNVGIFKNRGNYIKGLYLSYYLDSEKAKSFIKKNIARTTQVYMTLGLLRKFPIAISKDKKEQCEIAGTLQTVDQKIEIEQKKKMLYEELFKTMLKKLMNREIRTDNLKI